MRSSSSRERLAPPRLADLHVRHLREVARIDRAALEARRRCDDHARDGAEVEALLQELVLVEHLARRPVDRLEADLQDALELHGLGRAAVNATGVVWKRRIVPETTRSPSRLAATSERAAAAELLLDRAPERDLEAVLARVVAEERDAHRTRRRRHARPSRRSGTRSRRAPSASAEPSDAASFRRRPSRPRTPSTPAM